MSVIISDSSNTSYDGHLSTANGFYRVEAYNWSSATNQNSSSNLSTARALPVTFANAGNLQGCVIAVNTTTGLASAPSDYNIVQSFQQIMGACTMDITTDKVTYTAHGLTDGTAVSFSTSGTLPTGITANVVYYVKNKTDNDFQLEASVGSGVINMTGANGSGHVLWIQRDTKTLTPTDILNTADNSDGNGILLPIRLTSAYAVDTNANKWRFCWVRSGGTTGTWNLIASYNVAANYIHAAWCDTKVTATNNDSVIQLDPIEIDTDFTAKGVLGTGVTTIAWAWATCRGLDPTVANVAKTTWDTTATRTLTIDGYMCLGAHSGIRIGTSASRCTYANQAIISFPAPSIGTSCGMTVPISTSYYRGKQSVFFYGARPTTSDTLAENLPAGGTCTISNADPAVVTRTSHGFTTGQGCSFTTTGALPTGVSTATIYYVNVQSSSTLWLYDTYAHAIAGGATGRVATSSAGSGTHTVRPCIKTTTSTGWGVGQYVSCGGLNSQATTELYATKMTITAIDGQYIAVGAGMTVARLSGHAVINLNPGHGIKIIGNATSRPQLNIWYPNNLIFDGVELNDVSALVTHDTGSVAGVSGGGEEAANRSKWYVTYCSMWMPLYGGAGSYVHAIPIPPDGFEISHNVAGYYGVLFYNSVWAYSTTASWRSGLLLIDSNIQLGLVSVMGPITTSSPALQYTISNNIFEYGYTSNYYLMLNGLNVTLSGNKFFGFGQGTTGGLTTNNVYFLTGSGNYFDNCATAIMFNTGNTLNNVLTDTVFGSEVANTNDFYLGDGVLFGWEELSPTGDLTVNTTYLANCATGSELKLSNYDDTAGDIRSWQPEGKFVSSSGKIVGQTIDSNLTLANVYNCSSDTIADAPCAAVVNCQIANAAYYAGTHVQPKLTVTYDGGTTAVDTADENTNAQELLATFTPTTSNGTITATLSQKTDATGTDANVTWDSLTFRTRKYGYIFSEYIKTITETTSDTVFNFGTPVTNTLITESNAVTVAAYTGITISHSTQTATISSNHTWAEFFDYVQYDLTQNFDKADWLTSTDGVTFTSDYDIVVDGCTLNATGKIIDCGTNDFQLANGGAVTATRVTDVDGTAVSVVLSGIVVGSIYDVYKGDGTSLGSGTAGATTVTLNYTHTGDVAVTCRVRKAGYLEYSGTGTVTTSGLTFNIAQSTDLNYNASYAAGVATDWTLNTTALTLEHTSGTTAYTSRDLYSWTMDYMANATRMQKNLPMSASTPFDFTLQNSHTMTDGSHEYLQGGSITEDSGDVLWANVYTVGSIASGNLYIYQNGSEYTKFWGNGNIDVLLKVKDSGALIDSGYVTIFTREFGYSFDHYKVDLSNGGRTAVSVSNAADSNNDTLEATVAGWTDITVTTGGGPYSKDIGDGQGEQPYTTVIDAGGHAIKDVYERLKYISEEGQSGEAYTRANAAWTEVKTAPYGTFAGGVFFGARGIWVENVDTGDALNYIVIDNDGDTHQAPSPPVAITVSSIVSGSTLYIYDQSNSEELVNEVVNDTSYEYEYAGGTGKTIIVKLRKMGYSTFETSGITNASGLSITGAQEADAVAVAYPGGIATDFSVNTTTKEISHASGATVYTVRQLHSWLVDTFAGTTYMEFDVPTKAYTNYEFELINSYTIPTEAHHEYLKTGSIIEDDGDTLFGNLYTVGNLEASNTVYVYQNSSKVTAWWGAGHIDILIKVKTGGNLIDSGKLDVFTRNFNYFYDHSTVTITEGGKNPASLSSGDDTSNTTAEETVAGWTGMSITTGGGPYMKDIGDGQGEQPYTTVIDANDETLATLYEWLKYQTEEGQSGEAYTRANVAYPELKTAPYGTYAGGTFLAAQGIWIENIDVNDALNYVLTDNNGVTHQEPTPPAVLSVTLSSYPCRIQVYDSTDNIELANEVVPEESFGFWWLEYDAGLAGHVFRIRVSEPGLEFWENNFYPSADGLTVDVTLEDDSVYVANNVDGSTVTEFSVSGTTVKVFVDDPDNATTVQRLYNWFCYLLSTEDGIRDQGNYIRATDAANYVFYNSLTIQNLDLVNPLVINGGYFVLSTGGTPVDCYDTTGGPIFMGYPHVVGMPYSSGSGLSAEEHNQLMGISPSGLTEDEHDQLMKTMTVGTYLGIK